MAFPTWNEKGKENRHLRGSAAVGQAGEKCGLMYLVVCFISSLSWLESKYPEEKSTKVSQK